MANTEALIKEFNAARAKYQELLAELIRLKVPGIVNPVAAGCSVGEVCHGGTFDVARDLGRPVEKT